MLRRITTTIVASFFAVLSIALALVLWVFQLKLGLVSRSSGYIVINVVLAVLISFGISVVGIAGAVVSARLMRRAWRRLLVLLALFTIERAVNTATKPILSNGIASRQGRVVIGLAAGSRERIALGTLVGVTNSASGELWGYLEVIELGEHSCVCQVSDRINEEFWESLEFRMGRDPAPPLGVTFTRDVLVESLEVVKGFPQDWGG